MPAEETPAFGGIAERFRRAGDLERAIALCRDGLKRFPDQLSARVTLGWSLLDKGQYDLARAELEQVLRRAPDNLAAIRGLAELHDRTEGSLPSDEERWRNDEAAEAAAQGAVEPGAPAPDRFAPIPVSLSNTKVELMSTAAYAEQAAEAAASAFEPAAGISVGPVELERPAAASMAAADPSSFFAVDPAETMDFGPGGAADGAPVPFEVAGVEPVEVEIETAGAAALSQFGPADVNSATALSFDAVEVESLTTLSLESTGVEFVAETTAFDPGVPGTDEDQISESEIDWASLASDEPSEPVPTAAADVDAIAAFSSLADASADLDASFEVAGSVGAIEDRTEGRGHIDEPPASLIALPEGLEDIDEAAGQDLGDAIRALEDAAKRVGSRLAPRRLTNEPATSPQEIALFDFGAAATPAEHDTAAAETRQDGSFELEAPDLTDLTFGAQPAAEGETTVHENDWTFEAASSDVAAQPEVANAVDAAADAVEAGVSGDAELAELAGLLEVVDVPEIQEVAEFTGCADIREDDAAAVADDQVEPPSAAAVPSDAADEAEEQREAGEPSADAPGEDLPVAAIVATELDAPTVLAHDAADAALIEHTLTSPAFEPSSAPAPPGFVAEPEPLPAMHVYDSPVLAASATVAEVAALVSSDDVPTAMPVMGRAQTSARSPLAALERFLHKVQARQLELRSETMA